MGLALILWRNNQHKQIAFVLLQKQTEETNTQRVKAEKALGDLQVRQAQLIQSEKMGKPWRLTAGIGHEIQNPLNQELLVEMKDEIEKGNTDQLINRE